MKKLEGFKQSSLVIVIYRNPFNVGELFNYE